jgi:hypothetical protein
MQVKRKRKPTFSPNWCAFELLFQHLKHEALHKGKFFLKKIYETHQINGSFFGM